MIPSPALGTAYSLPPQWCFTDGAGLAQLIISRLSEDQLLGLAGDALAWAPHPTDRQELALQYVQNFVLAMESDPDAK